MRDIYLINDDPLSKWCSTVPSKINIFIWRARRSRLPTKLNLIRREVSGISPLCTLCSIRDETEEHLFLRCSTAKEIMARLKTWWNAMPNLDSIGSLEDLLNHRQGSKDANAYEVVMYAFLWNLWLLRI